MAVKPPRPEQKVKDVDDVHADKFHGQEPPAERARVEKKDLTNPEQRTHDAQFDEKIQVKRKKNEKTEKQKKQKKRDQEQKKQEKEEEDGVKAGQLALDDNYQRRAQALGLDGSPTVEEILDGIDSDNPGESLGEMLGRVRVRHPDLPEAEIEPPQFLKPLEQLDDIYMKTKGRVSRKTKELLQCIDLEDLIDMMHGLFDDEPLVKKAEARLRPPLLAKLGADPGPLLVGFHDPRLTELWRLFLEGWDLWVPEGKETGVELFWEGEAEDDDGELIEILWTLQYREGEATLHAKLGDIEDKIMFDGEAFYRLKHEA